MHPEIVAHYEKLGFRIEKTLRESGSCEWHAVKDLPFEPEWDALFPGELNTLSIWISSTIPMDPEFTLYHFKDHCVSEAEMLRLLKLKVFW